MKMNFKSKLQCLNENSFGIPVQPLRQHGKYIKHILCCMCYTIKDAVVLMQLGTQRDSTSSGQNNTLVNNEFG